MVGIEIGFIWHWLGSDKDKQSVGIDFQHYIFHKRSAIQLRAISNRVIDLLNLVRYVM